MSWQRFLAWQAKPRLPYDTDSQGTSSLARMGSRKDEALYEVTRSPNDQLEAPATSLLWVPCWCHWVQQGEDRIFYLRLRPSQTSETPSPSSKRFSIVVYSSPIRLQDARSCPDNTCPTTMRYGRPGLKAPVVKVGSRKGRGYTRRHWWAKSSALGPCSSLPSVPCWCHLHRQWAKRHHWDTFRLGDRRPRASRLS